MTHTLFEQADVVASFQNIGGITDSKEMYLLWEWECIENKDTTQTEVYEENSSDSDVDSQPEELRDAGDEIMPLDTHTVTFKCTDANRSPSYQTALKTVSELLRDGHNVPVKLFPEPDNPVDSKAIAF